MQIGRFNGHFEGVLGSAMLLLVPLTDLLLLLRYLLVFLTLLLLLLTGYHLTY
jgi:hypothetical protein